MSSFSVDLAGGNDRFGSVFHSVGLSPFDPPALFAGAAGNGEVEAGSGNDSVVIGSSAVEFCGGLAGCWQYLVAGGSGRDSLRIRDTGQGNFVTGESGSDRISSFRNGRRDTVLCGRGRRDRVTVDLTDVVADPRQCNTIRRAPKDQFPVVAIKGRKAKVRNGRAAVKLKCPKKVATKGCRGKLTVKRGKKGKGKLGSKRYRIKKGKKKTVRVRVGGHRGTVTAIAREKGTDGRPKTTRAQLKVRP